MRGSGWWGQGSRGMVGSEGRCGGVWGVTGFLGAIQ